MTGVNFAVASTGALAVCTNEGNADHGHVVPPTCTSPSWGWRR
nr:LUD domain-containing protein [Alistipes onderdonkii]